MNENFAKRLDTAMKIRNIKASELSKKANIPKSAISQYLSGLNENGIILQPLNNSYSPVSYSNKEIEELPVKILGIVEEIRRKKRRK